MRRETLKSIMPLIIIASLITLVWVLPHVAAQGQGVVSEALANAIARGGKAIGAGLAIGLAGIGAGYAIGVAGAAGISVLAEKPEMLGQVLLIIALGEGVAIYGLLIAILVLFTG